MSSIPLPSQVTRLDELRAALDAATHEQRVGWLRRLGAKEQARLWELAEGFTATVEELHGAEGETVIHEGQNTLPMFNQFQKRVVLRGGVIQGYNHQDMSWVTGPGHFLVKEATSPHSGAHFSYLEVAKDVPADFPPLRPNDKGLSTLVYGHMIDYLRRVSKHVVIGAAYKKGKASGDLFTLVRR